MLALEGGAAEVGVAVRGVGGAVSMAESGVDCREEERLSRVVFLAPFFDVGAMAGKSLRLVGWIGRR